MSRRKTTTKLVVKEEDEGELTLTTKSVEEMKTKLNGFAYTSKSRAVATRARTMRTSTTESLPIKRKRSSSLEEKAATSPRKPKAFKMKLDEPHAAPKNWNITYKAIEEMRKGGTAPVDSMGCHVPMLDARIDQKTRRFITLLSLMLSSQTKDEVTFTAVQKLRVAMEPADANPHEVYLTPAAIRSAPISQIEECINKVGFWRRKAQYIKDTAEILGKEYDDDIPRSIEGLCALPGVGMKMAMLAMQSAWGDNVGIGVDVHVHRITNRLHWHKKETKTPEETRLNLESWLPKEFHPTINPLLVGFGQTICTPVRPKCDECLLSKASFELDGEEVEGPLCPSAYKESGSPRKKTTKVESVKLEAEAKIKVELE